MRHFLPTYVLPTMNLTCKFLLHFHIALMIFSIFRVGDVHSMILTRNMHHQLSPLFCPFSSLPVSTMSITLTSFPGEVIHDASCSTQDQLQPLFLASVPSDRGCWSSTCALAKDILYERAWVVEIFSLFAVRIPRTRFGARKPPLQSGQCRSSR